MDVNGLHTIESNNLFNRLGASLIVDDDCVFKILVIVIIKGKYKNYF